MLTRTLPQRGLAAFAATALAVLSVMAAPSAMAEGDADCDLGICTVVGEVPGAPGGGGGDLSQPVVNPGGGEGAAAPGVDYCQDGKPYGDRAGCYHNYDARMQCVWQMMSPQMPPPAGKDPSRGAWEECMPAAGFTSNLDPSTWPRRWWENSVTPGTTTTPAEAAREVVAQMQLKGIKIGMVPESVSERSDAMGVVGMPAWMWVDNPDDPRAWGPYTVTRVVGGLEVTATAKPRQVVWDMGDGTKVVCTSAGTPYRESYGKQASPDCGHKYMRTGSFTVSAVTTWDVQWSAAGESGVIQTVTRSSQPVKIGDLQAVNVTPRG